jgi:ureidoacrylate peracid hydrolase
MIDPARTALLTIDLQNDFLHPEGAYGRAGQSSTAMAALPDRIRPVADLLRAAGGVFVSAQFTLVAGRTGEPLISEHLKRLRPFLGRGDFLPGAFGHDLVAALQPADFTIEKVAYSAFWQTRLDHLLRQLGIDTLIVGGIVTNGGVASTVRDAHLRDLRTILLTDGCGAFAAEVHAATLLSLATLTTQMSCAQVCEALK